MLRHSTPVGGLAHRQTEGASRSESPLRQVSLLPAAGLEPTPLQVCARHRGSSTAGHIQKPLLSAQQRFRGGGALTLSPRGEPPVPAALPCFTSRFGMARGGSRALLIHHTGSAGSSTSCQRHIVSSSSASGLLDHLVRVSQASPRASVDVRFTRRRASTAPLLSGSSRRALTSLKAVR
jgi:hypothetical protein